MDSLREYKSKFIYWATLYEALPRYGEAGGQRSENAAEGVQY